MEQNATNKTLTKQALWERKLLDLSLRNSLLNFRPTISSVQLSAGNTAELENRIYSDDSFKIVPCEDGSAFEQNELKLYQENRASEDIIADLDKKKINTYLSLIVAMVLGRLVWGFVQLCIVGFDVSKFSLSAFWAGSVMNALPGIAIQLIFIPVLVMVLENFKKKQKV